MLSHYIKVSFQELLKYRTQSVVSIIGLAIGFTAFILGGYWLWETHFDNFHPEADRLYCLTTEGLVKRANGTNSDLDQLHVDDRKELFQLLPEIEASCSFNHLSFTLKQKDETISLHGMESDHSFFDLFWADFIAGTYKGKAPDGSNVILTERTAHQLFGTTDCVGKEVALDEDLRPVVAGVIRNYPDNTDLLFDFLLIRSPRPNHVKRMTTYVRLQKNASITQVHTKLARYKSRADKKWKIHLLTAPEVHLRCHPEHSHPGIGWRNGFPERPYQPAGPLHRTAATETAEEPHIPLCRSLNKKHDAKGMHGVGTAVADRFPNCFLPDREYLPLLRKLYDLEPVRHLRKRQSPPFARLAFR
jgi:hypothetical protein